MAWSCKCDFLCRQDPSWNSFSFCWTVSCQKWHFSFPRERKALGFLVWFCFLFVATLLENNLFFSRMIPELWCVYQNQVPHSEWAPDLYTPELATQLFNPEFLGISCVMSKLIRTGRCTSNPAIDLLLKRVSQVKGSSGCLGLGQGWKKMSVEREEKQL